MKHGILIPSFLSPKPIEVSCSQSRSCLGPVAGGKSLSLLCLLALLLTGMVCRPASWLHLRALWKCSVAAPTAGRVSQKLRFHRSPDGSFALGKDTLAYSSLVIPGLLASLIRSPWRSHVEGRGGHFGDFFEY